VETSAAGRENIVDRRMHEGVGDEAPEAATVLLAAGSLLDAADATLRQIVHFREKTMEVV
jgi:hypothetical protein